MLVGIYGWCWFIVRYAGIGVPVSLRRVCRPFVNGAMAPSSWLAKLLIPHADLTNAAHTGVSELDGTTSAYCTDGCHLNADITSTLR